MAPRHSFCKLGVEDANYVFVEVEASRDKVRTCIGVQNDDEMGIGRDGFGSVTRIEGNRRGIGAVACPI